MAKKVWISALNKDEKAVQAVMAACKKYALEPEGHFWSDDVEKMSWVEAVPALKNKDVALWAILGKPEDFGRDKTRFGLSLLTIAAAALRKGQLPIIIISPDGNISADSLPLMLKDADIVTLAGSTLGAKLVSRANQALRPPAIDYRLNVHGLPGIGLWFEIGPTSLNWQGIMAGVNGATIDAHGVGPAYGIPERAVLEYPIKGMKIQLGDAEFDTWAVKNNLDNSQSYYIRCQGMPRSFLFGQFSDDDEAEVHVLGFY
jgi:hypothetical protein